MAKSSSSSVYQADDSDYEFDQFGQLIPPSQPSHVDPPYIEEFSHAKQSPQDIIVTTGLPKSIYWEKGALENCWKAAVREYKEANPTHFGPPTTAPLSEKEKCDFAPLWYGLTPSPIPVAFTSASSIPLDLETATTSTSNKRPPSSLPTKAAKRQRIESLSPEELASMKKDFQKLKKGLLELEKSKIGLSREDGDEDGEGVLERIEKEVAEKRAILVQLNVEIRSYGTELACRSSPSSSVGSTNGKGKGKGNSKEKGKAKDVPSRTPVDYSNKDTYTPTSPQYQRPLSPFLIPTQPQSQPPSGSTSSITTPASTSSSTHPKAIGPQLPSNPLVSSSSHLPSPPPHPLPPSPPSLSSSSRFSLPIPPPIVPISTSSDLSELEELRVALYGYGGERGGNGEKEAQEALEKCLWNWYNAGYETAVYQMKVLREREREEEKRKRAGL